MCSERWGVKSSIFKFLATVLILVPFCSCYCTDHTILYCCDVSYIRDIIRRPMSFWNFLMRPLPRFYHDRRNAVCMDTTAMPVPIRWSTESVPSSRNCCVRSMMLVRYLQHTGGPWLEALWLVLVLLGRSMIFTNTNASIISADLLVVAITVPSIWKSRMDCLHSMLHS